jgi:DNA-binding transcriptional MerR regulator
MIKIPEKRYFKIGEVSKLTGVKPYVLRYWESEFKIISPRKSNGKQRVYTREEVDTILVIKNLLYKDGFTLEGAKKKIKEVKREKIKQLAFPFNETQYQNALKNIRKELNSIKKILAPS